MIIVISLYVFILGLLFGSFATVLITRWHEKEDGIFFGRSKCPKCKHTLSWFELFPLFSYIFLRGKCRKCREKIPFFYPLAELIMGSIFLLVTLSYIKNIGFDFNAGYVLLLFFGFTTGVYVLSDILYMEIPDEIMAPGIYFTLILLILGFYIDDLSLLFFDRGTYTGTYSSFFFDHISGALILYTFLYLQILIPATIQLSKKKRWKEIGEVVLSYFTFFYFLIFPSKDSDTGEKDEESLDVWVGGGDLRIALFIGLTLGLSHGIFSFFIAYMSGSIIGIFILLFREKGRTQIPFGPFLAIGWCTALYFHTEIVILVEYYKSLF